MNTNMKKISQGFKAAVAGLKETLIRETNFKIMAIAAVLVVFLMFYFPTTRLEKTALLLTIFSVLTLELINSTVERIMNLLHPHDGEGVRIIKDLTAAIVLVASLGAIIIGLVIFLPYFLQ